ncbi:hypothetical protein GIB67_012690 [Kingdonia uniflora]|uniref:HAT C-terminal dimerisation domain-containing protein n=1 Tax=Kingdonia uniflora TaxID=39325 RepID=A0A7J7NFF0_9MAGN|nr:hypothetical protein GIB67_012690 [Kingdonia uniflora]
MPQHLAPSVLYPPFPIFFLSPYTHIQWPPFSIPPQPLLAPPPTVLPPIYPSLAKQFAQAEERRTNQLCLECKDRRQKLKAERQRRLDENDRKHRALDELRHTVLELYQVQPQGAPICSGAPSPCAFPPVHALAPTPRLKCLWSTLVLKVPPLVCPQIQYTLASPLKRTRLIPPFEPSDILPGNAWENAMLSTPPTRGPATHNLSVLPLEQPTSPNKSLARKSMPPFALAPTILRTLGVASTTQSIQNFSPSRILGKICFTLDMWTSNPKLGYLCLTGNFISNDWKLHKQIISFTMVYSPHAGHILCDSIYACLLGLNLTHKGSLENIQESSDTSDHLNTSNNDFFMPVKHNIKMRKLPLDIQHRWSATYLVLDATIPYLKRYLDQIPIKVSSKYLFDLLDWWKANEYMYPILVVMARDLLTIPISTITSESAFSAGEQVLSKYRSCLLPETVEVLICLRD